MRKFTRYKKDKIAHFHKDNWLSLIKTIEEFWITYKELYKVIENSRIFNFQIINWVNNKKCSSCGSMKPYTSEYYYTRQTWTLYSACKTCMKQLSRTYKILNKKKIYENRSEYYKDYKVKQKERIAKYQRWYYKKHKRNILSIKKDSYKKRKLKFLKAFLFKLK